MVEISVFWCFAPMTSKAINDERYSGVIMHRLISADEWRMIIGYVRWIWAWFGSDSIGVRGVEIWVFWVCYVWRLKNTLWSTFWKPPYLHNKSDNEVDSFFDLYLWGVSTPKCNASTPGAIFMEIQLLASTLIFSGWERKIGVDADNCISMSIALQTSLKHVSELFILASNRSKEQLLHESLWLWRDGVRKKVEKMVAEGEKRGLMAHFISLWWMGGFGLSSTFWRSSYSILHWNAIKHYLSHCGCGDMVNTKKASRALF